MESKILNPKFFKTFLLLLGSIGFVVIGFYMIDEEPFVAWTSIIFFGIGVVGFFIQLINPKTSHLKLSAEGFEMRSVFRREFTKWSDVTEFSSGQIGQNKMVFFNYHEAHTKYKFGKMISKFFSGSEGAIPTNFGMSASELAKLMNESKAKYTNKHNNNV